MKGNGGREAGRSAARESGRSAARESGRNAAEGTGGGSFPGTGVNSGRGPGRSAGGWAGFLIGPAFAGLALWFLFGPDLAVIPLGKATAVNEAFLTTAPRRAVLGDPPVIRINGFDRTCNDCHRLFPPRSNPPKKLRQHGHVVLHHGINDRCRNCHDVKDRNRLVLRSGESISYSEVTSLCGSCHGPIMRDWRLGLHGRTNGYWDPSQGVRRRLLCTQCHDPHDPRTPAMDPLRPLPPPRTLRAGQAEKGEGAGRGRGGAAGEAKEADPLRRALRRAGEKGKAGGLVPEGPGDRGAMEAASAEVSPMEKKK